MEELIRKRGRTKAKITRIENYILENESNLNICVNDISIRETLLVKAFDEYNNVQEQVEDEDESQVADREIIEERYIAIHSKIKTIIQRIAVTASVASSSINKNDSVHGDNIQSPLATPSRKVNLPNLNIPTFSGKYEDWPSFIDLFSALIDNDTQLSKAQKFLYLKSVLKNEPFSLISDLHITDDNYTIALNLLKERYDNKMAIINSHIRALVDEVQVIKGNSNALRDFITKIKQHFNALKALGVPVVTWDLILIYMFSSKLDFQTHRSFELERDLKVTPTLADFLRFLEKRCLALESIAHPDQNRGKQYKSSNSSVQAYSTTNSNYNKGIKAPKEKECMFCNIPNHNIYKCFKFCSLPISQKREFVSKNKLCYNCLGTKHIVTQCTSERCRQCSGRHHTLLHDAQRNTQGSSSHVNNNDNPRINEMSITTSNATPSIAHVSPTPPENLNSANYEERQCMVSGNLNRQQILLATAQVNLIAENGNKVPARALLDSASQTSFVTAHIMKKLGATQYRTNLHVSGICNSTAQVNQMTDLLIESQSVIGEKIKVSCGVLNKITFSLPHTVVDVQCLNLPKNIVLADKQFYLPAQIDILLGADVYYDLIEPGIIKLGLNLPVLQNSKLGWVIGGPISSQEYSLSNVSVSLFCQTPDINELIPKFWQLEELDSKRFLSQDDKLCEEIFSNSVKRVENGFFQVDLPIRNVHDHLKLGNSYYLAAQRFYSIERRLSKDHELHSQYKQFIDEYVTLGHGKYVTFDTYKIDDFSGKCFIPHHCVIRESSVSTRLRVVFDASMKTSSGISLNDIMLKGFPVQSELFDILCRFRTFKYVLTTDIQKMYRMIKINPKQRFLQNILWRDNPNDNLKCIELQTVTYGTNSAPYLATRSLKQLADDEYKNYPLASNAISYQCYVDDILCGSNSRKETIELREQLIHMLGSAGFKLHKWCSNDASLLNTDTDIHQQGIEVNIDNEDSSNKILGLSWNSTSDKLKVSSVHFDQSQVNTKRRILSKIAQLFDPLGLIGPVIVVAKILMQQIWASKISWDEEVPPNILQKWLTFSNNISQLLNLSIPRWLFSSNSLTEIQIHGFADASLLAYGSCIYIRGLYSNKSVSSNLLCSKSRIAPLKTVTLPRLELCGALLLSRLTHKVLSIFSQKINKVFLWTDSKIVLCWLKASPARWNTFVANRVSEIQELTTNAEWHHVNSSENPADYLSRGMSPVDILSKKPWWQGPEFLLDYEYNVSTESSDIFKIESIPEQRKIVHTQITLEPMFPWLRFSKFTHLQRSLAYCVRFANNAKGRTEKLSGPLSVVELKTALFRIIKGIQLENFGNELEELKTKTRPVINTLKSLNPFLDCDGILRINGRLSNANIDYNQRYPILLPSRNHVVKLLIKLEHIKLFHAGAQTVLSNIRLRYWPIHGLREVKSVLKGCTICHRFKAETAQQLMGSLPSERVSITRPFLNVGIDFGGPISVKQSRLRNSTITKGYFALFVCMATKAIHLELVSSLSTEAFLLTLKRFISRRGNPSVIYSDNATNFHGANNQLQQIYKFFKSKENRDSVQNYLASREIQWKFIPPRSPHWGGLWEAGIKSTKYHLRRVVGNASLTFEELTTVLAQIEAILNSRPLCPLSTDPSDLACLTPSHFLIGESITSYPEIDVSNVFENRLSIWKKVSKIQQHFWKRWSTEYLNRLQNRPKWYKTSENLKENMIVLVKDDDAPPLNWAIARIIELLPGSDNKVRVVKIKTKEGVFIRPITKLCPLPQDSF